ncbi:hypothetical protein L228DRAFT_245275 [Xylona heveae TC161]|uniref:Methyltransferase n=1 Tax=Xylona heveae (strain CBS 132557 / TC161) TaxID=1328760 RepID=A0A165I403_XYLHT|nr:hypothetical protein L228DRAFT_245275 [Xylona heveae TC161]KZF24350.1 hypothetical protein L228DRAFT_245275 [Xylona heveae TC161]
MLPTPSTSHVSFDNVYEPAEDSFLLLDALSAPSETAFLQHRFPAATASSGAATPAPLVVEVGTGSGVVLAFVTAHAKTIFGHTNVLTLATDVNRFACEAAQRTVQTAIKDVCDSDTQTPTTSAAPASSAAFLSPVLSDLTSAIRPGEIDMLIFNPPYVPTEELPILPSTHSIDTSAGSNQGVSSHSIFERDSYLLSLSYAGGADGMETTDRLLEQIPTILHPERGVAYLLLCAQNRPEDVKARIRAWGNGWAAETVATSGKTAGWERLQIVRIWRP